MTVLLGAQLATSTQAEIKNIYLLYLLTYLIEVGDLFSLDTALHIYEKGFFDSKKRNIRLQRARNYIWPDNAQKGKFQVSNDGCIDNGDLTQVN